MRVKRVLCSIPYKIIRLVSIIKTKYVFFCNDVKYKSYRIVGSPIVVVENGEVVFGENLQMNNGLLSNQIGYNTPCVFRAENGSITIGDNVGISQTSLIASGADITIGRNVKMGGGVKVYTTDFHCLNYMDRRNPMIDLAKREYAPVTIEDDCFIGAGVIILKGVHIGARSVIGAGSVVTKDVPADCMAGGNPCKIIRSLGE